MAGHEQVQSFLALAVGTPSSHREQQLRRGVSVVGLEAHLEVGERDVGPSDRMSLPRVSRAAAAATVQLLVAKVDSSLAAATMMWAR